MISSYVACEYDGHWWLSIVQERRDHMRSNIGIGVLIDQILTTHMNVPGMEPAYASGKEAHVLIYNI
jgi:hypothetical protein